MVAPDPSAYIIESLSFSSRILESVSHPIIKHLLAIPDLIKDFA